MLVSFTSRRHGSSHRSGRRNHLGGHGHGRYHPHAPFDHLDRFFGIPHDETKAGNRGDTNDSTTDESDSSDAEFLTYPWAHKPWWSNSEGPFPAAHGGVPRAHEERCHRRSRHHHRHHHHHFHGGRNHHHDFEGTHFNFHDLHGPFQGHRHPRRVGVRGSNFTEDAENYMIELPLAGISFQHVSVQVEDDHILVIKTNLPSATSASPTVEASNVKDGRSLRPGEGNGTSSANQATRHVNYRVPFPRSSINADNINAKFRDGLLLMLIPKVPISLRNIPVAS